MTLAEIVHQELDPDPDPDSFSRCGFGSWAASTLCGSTTLVKIHMFVNIIVIYLNNSHLSQNSLGNTVGVNIK